MRAERPGPAQGQAVFALGTVLVLVATILWLQRTGARAPAEATAGMAPSGAWFCPHGGGEAWTVALFLANPGSAPVTARVTQLGHEAAKPPDPVEVPPASTVRIDLSSNERGDATYVEYFGGWIGAGWVSLTGPDEQGIAAEPCAPEASRRWYLADGTTQLGEEAFVIVANPFDVAAVLDVAIYTSDRAPIRDSEWTDLVVPAGRSIALRLNSKVEGEPAVAVELDVSVGRVAAASLGVTDRTKARSALGWTEAATEAIFPVMRGSGQTELLVLSTADRSTRFGATSLSEDQPRPAGGLTEQDHAPAAVSAYPIPVEGGPEAIQMFTLDDERAISALRARGPGEDAGATAGAVSASTSWVIFPAMTGGRSRPGAVLVNPGEADAVVTVTILQEGGTAAAPITVGVPARSAAAVPPEFLETAPGAALLVRSEGAPIVALAATTSLARGGGDGYALSMGVTLR